MSDYEPRVTVLIAARPGQTEVKAVAASLGLDYPSEKLEIIVARGKQPSVQRNTGINAAHGELVYFLDDDSVPLPGNLRRAVAHFVRPEVKMVGGPNLCPPSAPEFEQVFGLVLASWALGPSRARYIPVGGLRNTSEKELILCNLLARRAALVELGGFDEALYPNEENALMDELCNRGGELIYDPEFFVFRRPRPTLKAFARMLRTYGRGRAEQFRLHPTFGSTLNLVPPLFVVYLMSLPATVWLGRLYLAPLAVYGLALLAQVAALLGARTAPRNCAEGSASRGPVPVAAASSPRPTSAGEENAQIPRLSPTAVEPQVAGFPTRLRRSLCAAPLLFFTHVLYGLGFWRGLFTALKPPLERQSVPVTLEVVKSMPMTVEGTSAKRD